MIIVQKIKLIVGETIKGCFSCEGLAVWVIMGVDHAYYCHPHLCIISQKIEKAVTENE